MTNLIFTYGVVGIIRRKGMDKDWIELLVTDDTLEAEMIKDLLESGGIPVVLRSSKVTPYPVNIGKMGEIKIMVRNEDKEQAEEVLKEIDHR
jgi:hypothetical protein